MNRAEINVLLAKLSALEGRLFDSAQGDAWFEVLCSHSVEDALSAAITFHSKPFVRVAYPGDIKELIGEIEQRRVESLGGLELNEKDWFEADAPMVPYSRLYAAVRSGVMKRADYLAYRKSGLTLADFLEGGKGTADA